VRIDGQSHALEFVSLHESFLANKLDDPPRFGFATRREIARNREQLRIASVMRAHSNADHFAAEEKELRADRGRIDALMLALNYDGIAVYQPRPSNLAMRALICRSQGDGPSDIQRVLSLASRRVFLLGPSNQQYLFLDTNTRKLLLGASPQAEGKDEEDEEDEEDEKLPVRPQIEYLTELERAQREMAGFYAYDWLSVTPLVQLFESAMKEDFKSVVKTGGYGSNYQALEKEINRLLVGKKVRPLPDLTGVEFIIVDEAGHETSLGPEDLSQGELKRLMIFAWLRANNAVDALVLIDEIELSLHPDWQVGIVRDLQEWAPKNQYILATHSYELCQAVTPRHVRELKPRLRSGEAEDSGSGHG
jgi:AAA domain, putative AbiEii toxin, Type IV TA system